ncbi:MAG: P-loop NTPase [Planctomycetes bacterium]|nr:P-loop NTPase [Planctomycetota bacterium]
MIISIASGKGGTGKTTLAVNLATALARSAEIQAPVRLLDCDVEEPNDHLFVQPRFDHTETVDVLKPSWNEELCTACGKCQDICNYNAIAVVKGKVLFFNELCHACGGCSYICPEGAMTEHPVSIGRVETADAKGEFAFGHGLLNVGEALAPKVVQAVKKHIRPNEITLIDASPGAACPVVEAVAGADVAVLVTEPTPFGLNDLKLAVGLSLKVGVPAAIVVNRSDGVDELIQRYSDEIGVPIIGRIPFRRSYAETYSRGERLVDRHPELTSILMNIYRRACEAALGPPQPVPKEQRKLPVAQEPREASHGGGGRFREITVISGKGGTGKTTITASLAALLEDKVLSDCDVDAADLHLLLHPEVKEVADFLGGYKALIDEEACTACGRCAEFCHFDAIAPVVEEDAAEPQSYRVNQFTCEGCGVCGYLCPVDAIAVEKAITGQSYVSDTPFGPLSHARLGIAEENSGKLVTRVRNIAADLAATHSAGAILGDGSPGTGCPVIASVSGVDAALIVTEPTVSGVHDLERVLQLTRHFQVQALVCINKCDLNAEQAERIRALALKHGATMLGDVPFDAEVNDCLMKGEVLVERGAGPAAQAVRALADGLRRHVSGEGA